MHGRDTTPVSEDHIRKLAPPAGSARIFPRLFSRMHREGRFFDNLFPSLFLHWRSCFRAVDWIVHWWAKLTCFTIFYKPKVSLFPLAACCAAKIISRTLFRTHCNEPTFVMFHVPKRLVHARLAIADRHFCLRIQLIGKENLPAADEAVMYIPNHCSYRESPLIS